MIHLILACIPGIPGKGSVAAFYPHGISANSTAAGFSDDWSDNHTKDYHLLSVQTVENKPRSENFAGQ